MLQDYTFKCAYTRRVPDPNFKDKGMETYSFLMRCRDVPAGIGNGPNARETNTRRATYKKVEESLLNQDGDDDGTFHLKNKGITIIAESVSQVNGGDIFQVKMDTGEHGIVDGGHTYEIIQKNMNSISDDQYVRIDVRTGVPAYWIHMISRGLNTAVQVQTMSLENLKESFDWVKAAIRPHHDDVAWNENAADKYMDARDIVAIMCMLNPIVFPNEKTEQPTVAYSSKEYALRKYRDEVASFKPIAPILKDILYLYDHIAYSAYEVWRDGSDRPTRTGALKIFEDKMKKKDMQYDFLFIGKTADYRLSKSALYPILGAFRRFVRRNELTNNLEWITGDFNEVLSFWNDNGRDMLMHCHEALRNAGYSLTSLGKNTNLWTTLHASTGMKIYEQDLAKTK